MEQYLTVGNCKPGEEKTFSLIEVYPYMHYDSSHTEDDLNRAFQFSLDPKRCSYIRCTNTPINVKHLLERLNGLN